MNVHHQNHRHWHHPRVQGQKKTEQMPQVAAADN
jgi:hypothetical protein